MTRQVHDVTADAEPAIVDTVLGDLAGYRLKRAYMRIRPAAGQALAQDGLRVVGFSCLSLIVDNPAIVQAQLAEALQIERPNLVLVIDDLEQRGLITRRKVPTDRRRYALHATLQGRRLRDRAADRLRRAEDGLIARLAPEDRQALQRALDALEALQD